MPEETIGPIFTDDQKYMVTLSFVVWERVGLQFRPKYLIKGDGAEQPMRVLRVDDNGMLTLDEQAAEQEIPIRLGRYEEDPTP